MVRDGGLGLCGFRNQHTRSKSLELPRDSRQLRPTPLSCLVRPTFLPFARPSYDPPPPLYAIDRAFADVLSRLRCHFLGRLILCHVPSKTDRCWPCGPQTNQTKHVVTDRQEGPSADL